MIIISKDFYNSLKDFEMRCIAKVKDKCSEFSDKCSQFFSSRSEESLNQSEKWKQKYDKIFVI